MCGAILIKQKKGFFVNEIDLPDFTIVNENKLNYNFKYVLNMHWLLILKLDKLIIIRALTSRIFRLGFEITFLLSKYFLSCKWLTSYSHKGRNLISEGGRGRNKSGRVREEPGTEGGVKKCWEKTSGGTLIRDPRVITTAGMSRKIIINYNLGNFTQYRFTGVWTSKVWFATVFSKYISFNPPVLPGPLQIDNK